MCYKGFLGVTPCLHNSLGLAKSFAALKTTPLQTNPVFHKCPAPRPQLHALAASAALLLSLDCTEEQGWFTPAPFSASSALCSCLARWLNPNSSGRGGRRNTPKAVKYPTSDPDETWTWVHPVIPRPFLNVHFLHLSTAIMSAPLTRASIVSITI
jgi:hypothetical protein